MMRELNTCEIEEVNGGVSAHDALTAYGSAIAAGALIGFMTGGPGGMLIGAVMGGSRVAISGGLAIISLSYMGRLKSH